MWNSETGRNVSNLVGHQGSIYSIKMTSDGSYGMSVGTDKHIRLWDVRAKAQICAIDGSAYGDMNEIVFTPSAGALDSGNSSLENSMQMHLAGLACVGHQNGSLTFWDINMRKCLA